MFEKGYREDFLEAVRKYFEEHFEVEGIDIEDVGYNENLRELRIELEEVEKFLVTVYDADEVDLGKIMYNINEDKSIAEIYEII